MAVTAAVAVLALACGGGPKVAGPVATTATTADPTVARRAYGDAVERAVADALRVADATPESAANDFGWRTRASAYRAMAAGLRSLEPPPTLSAEHHFLIAEAAALGDDAERVGRVPIRDRQSAGFSHAQRAREFEDKVAALAEAARR
jgi:hypothetical protein